MLKCPSFTTLRLLSTDCFFPAPAGIAGSVLRGLTTRQVMFFIMDLDFHALFLTMQHHRI